MLSLPQLCRLCGLLSLLAGCRSRLDPDGDGYDLAEDCDDEDPNVHPDAPELCDGVDNNCVNGVDEPTDDADQAWYLDQDEDGFGDRDAEAVMACADPSTDGQRYAALNTDCDDSDPDTSPAAVEVCDDLDNDCDGDADDEQDLEATWWADEDQDRYGDEDKTYESCETAPAHAVARGGDCDDQDARVHEDAAEVCDGVDQDCDGEVDEATTGPLGFADRDGDGYGDPNDSTSDCADGALPEDYVPNNQDCDDSNSDVNPASDKEAGACTGDDLIDYNCDGSVGDADADADGWTACEDCDDADPAISPDAAEICDGKDNDCDGAVDDGIGALWYPDADSDDYGDAALPLQACHQPKDGGLTWTIIGGDCDDGDPAVHPGAEEQLGDEVDSDCDDRELCYADADEDGYADSLGAPVESADNDCADPGEADGDAPAGDCDDGDAAVHPGASEVCDDADLDEDCDGLSDDDDPGVVGATKRTWYDDLDGDTYGDAASSSLSCDPGATQVSDATDCDDGRDDVHPGASEVCDSSDTDEDCDGLADDDDDSTDPGSWNTFYADLDGDGYGYDDLSSAIAMCDAVPGAVDNPDDCDDSNQDINPDATEVCDDDGNDEDCDGLVDDDDSTTDSSTWNTWYDDRDGDGFGDPASSSLSCDPAASQVENDLDCDDRDADISPRADELCDEVDNDCDEEIDESDASDASVWYTDHDGDGFGDPDAPVPSCEQPSGAVSDDTDCEDDDAGLNPDADESPGDEVDSDCDGQEICYADDDDDGYAADSGDTIPSADADCSDAGEASAAAPWDDCDDDDEDIHPGADETVGDEVDSDCDGQEICYADADDDGYRDDLGTTTVSADADCADTGEADDNTPVGDCDDTDGAFNPAADEFCADPTDYNCDGNSGYTDNDLDGWAACVDCDDSDGDINPDATEICDNVDNDCDDAIDDDDASLDLATATSWYQDSDRDGFGDNAAMTLGCDVPSGYVDLDTDCDDSDRAVHPGATEGVGDELDSDCDGRELCYADSDGDGDADAAETAVDSPDLDCSGSGEASDAIPRTDCDDSDGTVYTGATEICEDGLVNDCAWDEGQAMAACGLGGELSVGTADYVMTSDETDQHQIGYALDMLGDVNGDGLADFAVGANLALEYPTANRGAVYVVLGSSSHSGEETVTDAAAFILYGSTNGDWLGASVSAAGDIDGDGITDLLVGAPSNDAAATDAGLAALVLSSTSAYTGIITLSDADLVLYGYVADDKVGGAVAGAGDLDGDGVGDLLIASRDHDGDYAQGGAVWLISGADALAATSPGSLASASLMLLGAYNADANAGDSLAGNVDLDGDGLSDVLIGASRDNEGATVAGAVYVLLGDSYTTLAAAASSGSPPAASLANADLKLLGESGNYYVGQALDPAGDVDGDGLEDLLIGGPGSDAGGTFSGEAYLVTDLTGGATRDLSTAYLHLVGETAGDKAGWDVAGAGDVDGDGRPDLLVSAYYDYSSAELNRGITYLVLASTLPEGGGTLDLSQADARLDGADGTAGSGKGDHAGFSLAGGGDVNGDGFGDLLIGAPNLDTRLGAAYLFFGGGY